MSNAPHGLDHQRAGNLHCAQVEQVRLGENKVDQSGPKFRERVVVPLGQLVALDLVGKLVDEQVVDTRQQAPLWTQLPNVGC